MSICNLRLWGLLALVLAAGLGAKTPKAIVLGFDGIDPKLAREFMAAGELPNMQRLAEMQGFADLHTVFPSQSPVCWSSMMTGLNPGKHGVAGFVKRAEGSYEPQLGVVRVENVEPLGPAWKRLLGVLGFSVLAGASVAGVVRLFKVKRRAVMATFLVAGLGAGAGGGWINSMIPQSMKHPGNVREGTTFYESVAKAGNQVSALNAPMDWPVPQHPNVTQYAGFNVPDLRGTFGIYSFYTTAFNTGEFVKTEMGADVHRVRFDEKGHAQTTFNGARDVTHVTEAFPAVPVALDLTRSGEALEFRFHRDQSVLAEGKVELGAWSSWQELAFKLNPILTIHGRVRLHLEQLDPELRLYITPVEFNPKRPAGGLQLSSPPEFADQVDTLVGGIDTLGWPELTHPLYDENLRDEAFMQHLLGLEEKRAQVLYQQLEKGTQDLVIGWFYGNDRVSHMMYRYIDPDNPAFESLQSSKWKDAILQSYQFMDRTVGKVMDQYMGSDTLLLVLSDHGFAPFNRAVSINRWLRDQGYLVLKTDQARRHASDMFDPQTREALLTEVDWGKTRAYALGLGKIFLNIKGREPQGVVPPEESHTLALEIKRKFETLTDEARGGAKVVSRVYLRDGVEGEHPPTAWGPLADRAADMLVGFFPGYRVSWQTTLGFADEPVIFTNDKRWSGDHCSIDPRLIPGVLFSNRALPDRELSLMDIAPTILKKFGLPVPEETDGSALWD